MKATWGNHRLQADEVHGDISEEGVAEMGSSSFSVLSFPFNANWIKISVGWRCVFLHTGDKDVQMPAPSMGE